MASCDDKHLYFKSQIGMFRTLQNFPNWEDIKKTLTLMAEKKLSPEEIVKEVRSFKHFSVIDRNKANEYGKAKWSALYENYKKELPDIFQTISQFILSRPKFSIPLFKSGQNKRHIFSKQQILYLYASMVLCLIPRQQFDAVPQEASNYSYLMDFSYIFENEDYKTKTVVEFIKREISNKAAYGEKMEIVRQVENRTVEEIVEERKDAMMGKIRMESDNASIEDYYGELKVDFANKYLGGGALMSGCVQEEIMFANHPELFTAQLLCEVMKPNESIFLSGYKKYFKNSGYGYDTDYDGPETHEYKYDNNKMAKEYIAAIDAKPFGSANYYDQLTKKYIDRELLKAYVGFNFKEHNFSSVVTGNWGCGAFGGDRKVKLLIQWLACSLVGKEMIYCPFSSRTLLYNQPLFDRIQTMKIGDFYNKFTKSAELCMNRQQDSEDLNIYECLEQLL